VRLNGFSGTHKPLIVRIAVASEMTEKKNPRGLAAMMRYTVCAPFLSPHAMPPEIQIRDEIDIERLRVRLRGMTDEQLRQFGKAARYMVSARANLGKPPLQAFVIQWEEARAEWRRRHPKSSSPASSSE
jgi:hypothetical protein